MQGCQIPPLDAHWSVSFKLSAYTTAALGVDLLFIWGSMLVFCCCHNKRAQMQQLKATQVHFHNSSNHGTGWDQLGSLLRISQGQNQGLASLGLDLGALCENCPCRFIRIIDRMQLLIAVGPEFSQRGSTLPLQSSFDTPAYPLITHFSV